MSEAATERTDREAFPIVALVGSAGGLEAVARVLERLPADFAASRSS